MTYTTPGAPYLNSRDLDRRHDDLHALVTEYDADPLDTDNLIPDDDEREEHELLHNLVNDALSEGVADWQYGEHLIRDDLFVDHAQQLAEDTGSVKPNADWPLMHIDWEAAADALAEDYVTLDFGNYTYLARQG